MSDILAVTYDGAVPIDLSAADAVFTSPAAGFMVGSAGTVKFRTARNQDITLTFGLAGQGISIAFDKIYKVGTSCTGIVAFTANPYRGNT